MFEIDSELREYIKMGGFVGLAQTNPIAGDLEYNSNKIISFIKEAESLGLDIVVFHLNALIGYKMDDFFSRYPFIIQ